jgi:hypothetical protein
MNASESVTKSSSTASFDSAISASTNQTELTISNDEANNVSCFNRTVESCSKVLRRIKTNAFYIVGGACIGIISGLAGRSLATKPFNSQNANISSEVMTMVNEANDLIDYNKDYIVVTSTISTMLTGFTGYLAHKCLEK